jgi:hypothetical protein
MQNIPASIIAGFILLTLISVYLFYRATNKSTAFLIVALGWLAVQAVISLTGFYQQTNTLPPPFAFLIAPPLVAILGLFITAKGRRFIDGLDLRKLTLLHAIRIPVELFLFFIFLRKGIPQIMTFEGANPDILSGFTALVMFGVAFRYQQRKKTLLLVWNFICLGFLINIVTIAILAAPFQFQQLAFDQPNIGVLYFPFTWLPCAIVPLVLLSHLGAIRQLLRQQPAIANEVSKRTEHVYA